MSVDRIHEKSPDGLGRASEIILHEEATSRFLARLSLRSRSPLDLLLWAFIFDGMGLRLWSLDAMEFTKDEFTHMLGVYRAAVAPWSAPPLVNERHEPAARGLLYQFLAVPVSTTRDRTLIARRTSLPSWRCSSSSDEFFTPQIALWTTCSGETATPGLTRPDSAAEYPP
jgi:hypothetical protein